MKYKLVYIHLEQDLQLLCLPLINQGKKSCAMRPLALQTVPKAQWIARKGSCRGEFEKPM